MRKKGENGVMMIFFGGEGKSAWEISGGEMGDRGLFMATEGSEEVGEGVGEEACREDVHLSTRLSVSVLSPWSLV